MAADIKRLFGTKRTSSGGAAFLGAAGQQSHEEAESRSLGTSEPTEESNFSEPAAKRRRVITQHNDNGASTQTAKVAVLALVARVMALVTRVTAGNGEATNNDKRTTPSASPGHQVHYDRNQTRAPPAPCRHCGRNGHWNRDCHLRTARCHICNEICHIANICNRPNTLALPPRP